MHNRLRRLPAEQAEHRERKRLSNFNGWPNPDLASHVVAAPIVARQTIIVDGLTLTGPFTFTQTLPAPDAPPSSTTTSSTTTTTTSSAVASATDSGANAVGSISSGVVDAPPPPVVTPSPPSASAINPAASSSATAEANTNGSGVAGMSSTSHSLPTGAVVGIALACAALVLGTFVFFVRQRAIRQRKLRQSTAPWLGTAGFAQPPPQPPGQGFPATPAMAENGRDMGESSPGVSFARAQAAALAARTPPASVAVPPPPSAYGSSAVLPGGAVPAGAVSAAVRYEFIPSLPDELSIVTGEVVRVISEYDDGWALCSNARGEQGMVPLECLDRSSPAPGLPAPAGNGNRNSRRTSSLGVRY